MNEIVLTLDIDWAPDFMIDDAAECLVKAGVKATWLITHPSHAVERLRQKPDLFELGLHPNFLPGSTQGKTIEETLRYCLSIVPEAACARTHGVMQTNGVLQAFLQNRVTTDLSIFLPRVSRAEPFIYGWQGKELMRIPYVWEDSYEMEQKGPLWRLRSILETGPGLKIVNFHPVHVYLNSNTSTSYRTIKQAGIPLHQISLERAKPQRYNGVGARTLFLELVEYLRDRRRSHRIEDIRKKWLEQRASRRVKTHA